MTKSNNPIYCSTGAFIGMINGRNHRLLLEYGDQLNCDGFELMMYRDWYEKMDMVIQDLKASGLSFPVLHADKRTGDLLSNANSESSKECFELFKRNCDTAAQVGATKIVTHIWGVPDSDKHIESIMKDCGTLRNIAREFGLDMLAENCVCVNEDPMVHFPKLMKLYPDCGFIIDTRAAAFHGQTGAVFQNEGLWKEGHVRHLHISDYKGGIKDWNSLRPIPQPGKGNIDFVSFFANLKKYEYSGSISLEAPSMLPDAVDVETLNASLDFIRDGMKR